MSQKPIQVSIAVYSEMVRRGDIIDPDRELVAFDWDDPLERGYLWRAQTQSAYDIRMFGMAFFEVVE